MIPKVTDMSVEDAKKALDKAGFVGAAPAGAADTQMVQHQDPLPGNIPVFPPPKPGTVVNLILAP